MTKNPFIYSTILVMVIQGLGSIRGYPIDWLPIIFNILGAIWYEVKK